MKTTPVTHADLQRSVIAVPPLARTSDLELDGEANRRLLSYLREGGVSTAMYGGNANLYNISLRQYEELLDRLPEWAPEDMWLIPSVGPSFGRMLAKFARRFESAKNDAIAAMSQMSSSENPCSRSRAKSSSSIVAEASATLSAKSSMARSRGLKSALR